MDLFGNNLNPEANLLPEGGTVNYFGPILPPAEADRYYKILLETIAWKNDEAKIFGRHFITKRKAAWYGDSAFSYTYSNATKEALPWTPELLELKKLTEEKTNATYNSCLLNLYHTGEEGMAWHSDDEKTLQRFGAIASLSFWRRKEIRFHT